MESAKSVATIHFERLEKDVKEEKKQADEAQIAEDDNSFLDEAQNHRLPIGIRKMSAKAREDRIKRKEELQKLSQERMSNATRYFKKLEDEKKKASVANGSSNAGREERDTPIAIQKFTLADREKKLKKQADLYELRDNPPPVSVAAKHFQKRNDDVEGISVQLNETCITSGDSLE